MLKTLEEPPHRVIFILATTEVHKIPLTILSRVQRFEFYRVALEDIKTRLTEVVTALGRKVDQEAIQVIAQKSEGGLRDALSILDQCLVQDDPLGVEEVYQVLGMVGETYSVEIMEAFLTADYGKALGYSGPGDRTGEGSPANFAGIIGLFETSVTVPDDRADYDCPASCGKTDSAK